MADGTGSDGYAQRVNRLQRLTPALDVLRGPFRETYDGWIADSGRPNLPPGFLYAIATGLDRVRGRLALPPDPARDADAIALALAAFSEEADLVDFFGAACAAGLFDRPQDDGPAQAVRRRDLMKRLADTLGPAALDAVLPEARLQRTSTTSASLQAHDETVAWIDPGHLLPAIIPARRRLCRIDHIDRRGAATPLGTGFLVGPSAVLTNQHVVKEITRDRVRPDEIRCWFDFSATTGTRDTAAAQHFADPDWRIAESPHGREQPDGAEVDWWRDDAVLEAFLADVADDLDYAVIRLATAPGLQRGWYDLAALPQGGFSQHAVVLHHPASLHQSITLGTMDVSRAEDVRLFHQAATANGSSGGLLLNETGRPIGLHHAGISYTETVQDPAAPGGTRDRARFMNVAINLRAIAADLAARGAFAAIAAASPITPHLGCIANAQPVFGRAALLRDLHTMWANDGKRILIVAPPAAGTGPALTHPGKTFTAEIIRSLFRRPEHHHIVFRAGRTPALALEFARATIGSFAPDLVDGLPDAGDSTTPAYVQTLVKALGAAIQQRLSNASVWLMIDDLDHHAVLDSSGREFLATAYDQITRIPNLRVVLIGLPKNVQISGIDEETVIRSEIAAEDVSGFERLFRDWCAARLAFSDSIPPEAIEILAGMVSSYATGESPIATMAAFVKDHVNPVLDRQDGQAGPPAPAPAPEDPT